MDKNAACRIGHNNWLHRQERCFMWEPQTNTHVCTSASGWPNISLLSSFSWPFLEYYFFFWSNIYRLIKLTSAFTHLNCSIMFISLCFQWTHFVFQWLWNLCIWICKHWEHLKYFQPWEHAELVCEICLQTHGWLVTTFMCQITFPSTMDHMYDSGSIGYNRAEKFLLLGLS